MAGQPKLKDSKSLLHLFLSIGWGPNSLMGLVFLAPQYSAYFLFVGINM